MCVCSKCGVSSLNQCCRFACWLDDIFTPWNGFFPHRMRMQFFKCFGKSNWNFIWGFLSCESHTTRLYWFVRNLWHAEGITIVESPLNSIVYECVCVSVVQFCCIGSMMGKYNSIKLRPECVTHMNIHFHLSIRRFCEGNNSDCITSIEMHTHLTRCQHWKYNIFSGLVCVCIAILQ